MRVGNTNQSEGEDQQCPAAPDRNGINRILETIRLGVH
jgi:hypothetical protein